MKAITIREPYATMILEGRKKVEFRNWQTKHRGKLLLCASKKVDGPLAGKAFAICELNTIQRIPPKKLFEYAWILENVKPLKTPFEVRGWPGIFNVEI